MLTTMKFCLSCLNLLKKENSQKMRDRIKIDYPILIFYAFSGPNLFFENTNTPITNRIAERTTAQSI